MDGAIYLNALAMEPETRALARSLRRRDPDLLERLISQYEYRLYRYLLYLTGSAEAARDLFQETWLRVLTRGHQYDGVSRFEPWLFSIARHLAIDASRRRSVESFEGIFDAPGSGGRESRAPDDASPLAAYESHERSNRLGSVLARLPALYREVLLLRFQEELTLEEIAAVVRAPLPTVKSRLYRGLSAARELMEDQGS
jgi:RNA polymerase sigma-70 factor, ECF subfamily